MSIDKLSSQSYDPSQYEDPNISENTEFMKLGELQRFFDEKYASALGGKALNVLALGDIEVSE